MSNDYIRQCATRKHQALMHAVERTISEFPDDASQWQIYVAMNPAGITFETFEYITTPLWYCDPSDDPLNR
jgi:hypothetical protein